MAPSRTQIICPSISAKILSPCILTIETKLQGYSSGNGGNGVDNLHATKLKVAGSIPDEVNF
jgi:hypothetical protein